MWYMVIESQNPFRGQMKRVSARGKCDEVQTVARGGGWQKGVGLGLGTFTFTSAPDSLFD
jgi:hypothetical protein